MFGANVNDTLAVNAGSFFHGDSALLGDVVVGSGGNSADRTLTVHAETIFNTPVHARTDTFIGALDSSSVMTVSGNATFLGFSALANLEVKNTLYTADVWVGGEIQIGNPSWREQKKADILFCVDDKFNVLHDVGTDCLTALATVDPVTGSLTDCNTDMHSIRNSFTRGMQVPYSCNPYGESLLQL